MSAARVLALFEKHRITAVGRDRKDRAKFVCDNLDCDFSFVGNTSREKVERGHWAAVVAAAVTEHWASVVSGQVET